MNYERTAYSKMWFLILLLVTFVAGCASNPDEILPIAGGAPTVTSTTPANKATGVQINRRITATFSQEMDPATISISSFYVTGPSPSTAVVPGTFAYAGETAVFTPSSALATNSLYTATVTTSVKNKAGVVMAVNHIWTFTTGLTGDATAPTLITTGAADGDVGLPINRNITATFSEPMDPSTLVNPATNYKLTEFGSTTPIPGVVTYNGNTVTLNPTNDLKPLTKYTVSISTGAKDLAGNALMPGLRPNPWSWTTAAAADVIAPKVTNTNPANLLTDVPIDKKINVTFDKAMSLATMTTANFTVTETGVVGNLPGTVAYDVQNNIATFSPQNNLKPDTSYTVTVTNGAKDLAGNAVVVPSVNGLPVPNPWTFRTAATIVPPSTLAINLGSAESFGIAARAGMTSTGVSVVNGDIALYANPSCTDSTTAGAPNNCTSEKTWQSVTGLWVNGSIYYAGGPDDLIALQVTNDLNTAWLEGKAKVDTFATGFLSGQLAGKTLLKGVYHEASLNLANGGICILDAANDPNAVFIIKVDSSFTDSGTAGAGHSEIQLINGAQARNVWFVTGLDVTIGTGTIWNGNILAGQTLSISGGSRVVGRLLAGATGAGAFTMTTTSPAIITITVPE